MVTETDAWDAPPSVSLAERNSASRNTPAARPRTTTDSPPGGRRLPTVLSSRSASVTRWSPTRAGTTAALVEGTGGPSPEYRSDQRRSSSSSNFSLPTTGPPDRPTALVGLADGRTGGRRSARPAVRQSDQGGRAVGRSGGRQTEVRARRGAALVAAVLRRRTARPFDQRRSRPCARRRPAGH